MALAMADLEEALFEAIPQHIWQGDQLTRDTRRRELAKALAGTAFATLMQPHRLATAIRRGFSNPGALDENLTIYDYSALEIADELIGQLEVIE